MYCIVNVLCRIDNSTQHVHNAVHGIKNPQMNLLRQPHQIKMGYQLEKSEALYSALVQRTIPPSAAGTVPPAYQDNGNAPAPPPQMKMEAAAAAPDKPPAQEEMAAPEETPAEAPAEDAADKPQEAAPEEAPAEEAKE